MEINNTTSKVNFDDLVRAINEQFSNKQKIKLAKRMSEYCNMIDMSYVDELLVMAAKLRLLTIKNNKERFYKNHSYFKALKTITKIKIVE